MGASKQIMELWGKPLVRHAVEVATRSRADRVWVVTGAERRLVEKALLGLNVVATHNSNWRSGLSTSLQCGLVAACASDLALRGVIVVLADQPMVTTEILDSLIENHRAGFRTVSCDYGNGVDGPPALFDRMHFDALRALRGDQGAKCLLDRTRADLARVQFPDGSLDIDSRADLDRAEVRSFRCSKNATS